MGLRHLSLRTLALIFLLFLVKAQADVFRTGIHTASHRSKNPVTGAPRVIWYDNKRPRGDVVLVSCDELYFIEHAVPLIASARESENDIHVHVVNPQESFFKVAPLVAKQVGQISVSFSYEETNISSLDNATYYACNRFMIAEQILNKAERILILDADLLILSHLDFPPEKSLGLFTRESAEGTSGWVKEGTKLLAGIVFLTKDTSGFIRGVNNRITAYGLRWYVDQVSLHEQYVEDGWDHSDRFYEFNRDESKWFDWEFKPDSKIWVGKGERKYTNAAYVAKKKFFQKMIEI
ncbi:MAG: hypothetical protein CMB32_03645 [Euryarchaeota archaeon]|nr:hypothetical protein [Euryarchaeota archaeon]